MGFEEQSSKARSSVLAESIGMEHFFSSLHVKSATLRGIFFLKDCNSALFSIREGQYVLVIAEFVSLFPRRRTAKQVAIRQTLFCSTFSSPLHLHYRQFLLFTSLFSLFFSLHPFFPPLYNPAAINLRLPYKARSR